MKILVLFLVIILVCVVLYLAGAFSPGKSLRWQKTVDHKSRKAEATVQDQAGSFGNLFANGFRKARHAADHSAEKGRDTHEKITPD